MISILITIIALPISMLVGTLIGWSIPILYCIEPGCKRKVPLIVGMRKNRRYTCKVHSN
jgi:hypothetical protein